MKTSVIFAAIFLASLTYVRAKADYYLAPLEKGEDVVKDQYIVVLHDGFSAKNFTKKFTKLRTDPETTSSVNDTQTGNGVLYVYERVLNGFAARLSEDTLLQIRMNLAVKYVSQNMVKKAAIQGLEERVLKRGFANKTRNKVEPQRWLWNKTADMVGSWGQDRINQRALPLDGNDAHLSRGGGRDVDVYILDTGIYDDSLYFNGRAYRAFDAFGKTGIDRDGHGTHCAGTAGADLFGVAREANLNGVKVLNDNGVGSSATVIAGLEFVAINAVKPAIISMSLGGPPSRPEDDVARSLINDVGIAVVAAAGNEAQKACRVSPARVAEVITVAATDDRDRRAYFSNFGRCVDIFAPGVDIVSVRAGEPEGSVAYSGTSMACPHVTGVAALWLGQFPDMTPAELKDALINDATPGVVRRRRRRSPNLLLYAGP